MRQKAEVEEKKCSFKPQINAISEEIVNVNFSVQVACSNIVLKSKNRHEILEDHLIKAGRDIREKLDRARSTKVLQELEQYSFKPTINPMYVNLLLELNLLNLYY